MGDGGLRAMRRFLRGLWAHYEPLPVELADPAKDIRLGRASWHIPSPALQPGRQSETPSPKKKKGKKRKAEERREEERKGGDQDEDGKRDKPREERAMFLPP